VIPLLHWRRKVAAEQAKAQVEIQSGRARLVAESANLRAESQLERERLANFEEQIQIGNDYVAALRKFARMKKDEAEALADIPDDEIRSQIAAAFGLSINGQDKEASTNKPVISWRGGQPVEKLRGN